MRISLPSSLRRCFLSAGASRLALLQQRLAAGAGWRFVSSGSAAGAFDWLLVAAQQQEPPGWRFVSSRSLLSSRTSAGASSAAGASLQGFFSSASAAGASSAAAAGASSPASAAAHRRLQQEQLQLRQQQRLQLAAAFRSLLCSFTSRVHFLFSFEASSLLFVAGAGQHRSSIEPWRSSLSTFRSASVLLPP